MPKQSIPPESSSTPPRRGGALPPLVGLLPSLLAPKCGPLPSTPPLRFHCHHMTRGNKRDTDRLRAEARNNASKSHSTLKDREGVAAIMRQKQEAAELRKKQVAPPLPPSLPPNLKISAQHLPQKAADDQAQTERVASAREAAEADILREQEAANEASRLTQQKQRRESEHGQLERPYSMDAPTPTASTNFHTSSLQQQQSPAFSPGAHPPGSLDNTAPRPDLSNVKPNANLPHPTVAACPPPASAPPQSTAKSPAGPPPGLVPSSHYLPSRLCPMACEHRAYSSPLQPGSRSFVASVVDPTPEAASLCTEDESPQSSPTGAESPPSPAGATTRGDSCRDHIHPPDHALNSLSDRSTGEEARAITALPHPSPTPLCVDRRCRSFWTRNRGKSTR